MESSRNTQLLAIVATYVRHLLFGCVIDGRFSVSLLTFFFVADATRQGDTKKVSVKVIDQAASRTNDGVCRFLLTLHKHELQGRCKNRHDL